jgi:hypothetical protein
LSILVVVRRRALAGQEQALLAAMAAELRSSRPPRSLRARVFQGLSDRRAAIYIAEWSTREAYLAYNTPPLVALDALCTAPPRRWFCQPLDLFEADAEPPRVLTSSIFEAPPAAAMPLISFLMEQAGPALYQSTSCVLRALYQDLDHPSRFISLKGWRSEEQWTAAMAALAPRLDAEVEKLGATVEHFTGLLRADVHAAEPTA